ncbi:MAG: NAD-dependent epimerase [Actinobacteria bacterium]|jgi:putative NADH-flavin reductase|uniref:NAD(P)-dependent oxidoreductase n=2 Tax=Microbacteriaceae TaxID=85023 RepID=UPI000C4B8986|nr:MULTISPECIES: NAD(P)H-binding protein [Microbacterium]MEC8761355.1 NAD(P)H-binding protein [Actinomycetota bacterium]MBU20748.1 NAD-dependent epimerase [Microbacterium sp.]MCC4266326.1 NAD(P)H-binding protein [Microbacterium schleiferi]RUA27390.1 MAG: NAD-dependent epimerase [Actinomycetota bacterium]HAJ16577.1 NAD-dependent epimerase [Microbacterium sp.]|tara:strand:- start:143 stop:781 length:639 start_codon:yes stop_codon:yes gene_type:complete
MARIAVLGGTGYAGSHIVKEAVDRGHTVVSVARVAPAERIHGATYIEGTLLDVPGLVAELAGVDVVVSAVPGRGDMLGKVRPAIQQLLSVLPGDVRIGIIGGAGGSLVAPGGPRVIDSGFPDEFKPEAQEAIDILEDLQADSSGRDWFFVHPAGGFGAWNPGERTGKYRTGGDVIVTDADGESFISGADLAVAVLDEIENPQHVRGRFTVGY